MRHEERLLGYYNYTVILTYIGMLAGFMGIVCAFEGSTVSALICLMLAGFCDMFDGTVAATNRNRTPQEKCFGIQIDSLSDLICFGVLPASIVYAMSGRSIAVLSVCGLYVLCGLIRLAYFNVDEQERQQRSPGARELYYGLPVTLSALILPMAYGLCVKLSAGPCIPMAVLLAVMGTLFLLPFPLRKPHMLGKACVAVCGAAEVMMVFFACLEA